MTNRLRFFFVIALFAIPFINFAQGGSGKNLLTADSINKPTAYDLIDINYELERTQRTLAKLENSLKETRFEANIDSLLKNKKEFLEKEAAEFNDYNPRNLSKFFLENAFRAWQGNQKELITWKKIINGKLTSTQEGIDVLNKEKKVWTLSLKKLNQNTDVPIQLKQRISELIRDINNTKRNYNKNKKQYIIWEDKVTDLTLFSNSVIEKIRSLQEHLRDNLFVADKPPLWKVKVTKNDVFPVSIRFKKAWHENSKTVVNFLSQQNFLGLSVIIFLFVIGFFVLRYYYNKLNYDKEKPGFVNANKIFNIHWFASILLIVFTTIILFLSTIPLSLSATITIFILWSIYFILPGFMGKRGKVRIFMIFALFFINEVEIFMWYFGSLARYYITFEALLGIWLSYNYGLNRFKKESDNVAPFVRNVYALSIVLFALFIAALFSGLFGFVNLSVFLLKIAAKSATIVLVIYGIHKVLSIIIKSGCEIGKASKDNMLAGYWELIEKRLLQTLDVLAIFFAIKLILESMEVYRSILRWLTDVLIYKIKIGTITLSLGGIIGMILIFMLTFFMANVFRILFENHNYIKNRISKGMSFAISTTIRYLIIIFGIVLGLAYAGIDLGKFGLMAGALGVGIGFGLQNIVNNFISGLILLYERPIEVGDTIEVGNLMGEVKSIGVRASRVRTYDGAEVVVPNGNIISNDLINWTLSDNKRRLDIRIGVAYGSDPNQVLKLLQQVAVNHNKVLIEPAPRPLFIEFGDSSLNFRLLCWVHFEEGLGVKSEIFVDIYNALTEAGIEIPFPQMDVHLKDSLTKSPEIVMPKAPDNSSEVINSDKEPLPPEDNKEEN
jgi:small-conductance mechanosensitive channel